MIAFYHCRHRSGSFFCIFFFFLINCRWQSNIFLYVRYYLEFSLSSPRHCCVSQYLSNLIRTTLAPFLFLFVTSVRDSNPGLSTHTISLSLFKFQSKTPQPSFCILNFYKNQSDVVYLHRHQLLSSTSNCHESIS